MLRARSLSGKLLIVTLGCILVIEILIFALSVANYRLTWLARHFQTGEVISLALQSIPANEKGNVLRRKMLDTTQMEVVAIRQGGVSHILATRHMPRKVDHHIKITDPTRFPSLNSIIDGFETLFYGGNKIIRITGPMSQPDDQGKLVSLELAISDEPLRQAMLSHARNVIIVSFILSLVTALGIFVTLRNLFIRPLQRLSQQMLNFADDPHHEPKTPKDTKYETENEIEVAQEQFRIMNQQVRKTLGQQKRLADLGLAVSKINHDLRNILASARLFSDRLVHLKDPTAQRLAPRLVRIIDRAVSYTSAILTYGKAEETPPQISLVRLHPLFEEVAQLLALDLEKNVKWKNEVPKKLEVAADPEQLFRVLLNLCRNSVQVMTKENADDKTIIRRLTVKAEMKSKTNIFISDTGPGIDPKDKETLFSAFQTSGQGTGLGLAIAAEIIQAHNGTIKLLNDTRNGAHFKITLPN